MKKIFVIAILAISLCVNAQQKGIIDGFNLDNFPEVSFVYHSNNPEKLNKTNFWHLKEAGYNHDFQFSHINKNVENTKQHTIILWEDMAHNGHEQYVFTKSTLNQFFNEIVHKDNESFAIYAFNRRKNNPSALNKITDDFVTDGNIIKNCIQNYEHSTEHYQQFPNRSDMYTAIRESMEILAPLQGTKSIIVFTSGYPMENSGSDSESQVLKKAQDLHIPVYIIQYAYKSGVAANSEGFAKSTYGSFKSYRTSINTTLEQSVATASSDLIELYPQIRKRYQGNDYRITFISNAEKGDEARMINLSVDGIEIHEQLLPPPMTFGSWVKQNTALFIIILLALITAITLLILFIVNSKKKTAQQQELINRQQEDTKRLEELRKQDLETYESREKAKRLEEERLQKETEQEKLMNLMRIKNFYPRLTCDTGTDKFVYEINKPFTAIGREEENNDLVIDRPTVSRYHAEIAFNGTAFEIINKSQTNKVIVNGCFVDKGILKSNDKIGLGEVVITFYV